MSCFKFASRRMPACRSVRMYDIDGAKLRTWRLADRINDLIVCPDGKSLLYIESNKKINVLRLNEEREVCMRDAHCSMQAEIRAHEVRSCCPWNLSQKLPASYLHHWNLLSCCAPALRCMCPGDLPAGLLAGADADGWACHHQPGCVPGGCLPDCAHGVPHPAPVGPVLHHAAPGHPSPRSLPRTCAARPACCAARCAVPVRHNTTLMVSHTSRLCHPSHNAWTPWHLQRPSMSATWPALPLLMCGKLCRR